MLLHIVLAWKSWCVFRLDFIITNSETLGKSFALSFPQSLKCQGNMVVGVVLGEIGDGIKQEKPFIDTDNYQRERGVEAERRG